MGDKTAFYSILKFGGRAAAVCLAVSVAACAPSAEFQTAPQAGAWRSDSYPSFSQKPQAETAQFSAGDQARLSHELQADGQRLRGSAYAKQQAPQADGSAAAARKQAKQAIEETLQQIKGDSGSGSE